LPRFRSGKRQSSPSRQIPIIEEQSRVIANERILVTLQRFKEQNESILASTCLEEFSKFDASRSRDYLLKLHPPRLPGLLGTLPMLLLLFTIAQCRVGARSFRAARRLRNDARSGMQVTARVPLSSPREEFATLVRRGVLIARILPELPDDGN